MKNIIKTGCTLCFLLTGICDSNLTTIQEIKATEYHLHDTCAECIEFSDNDSKFRAVLCSKCGSASSAFKEYGPWSITSKSCAHYPNGTDDHFKRSVYTTYSCSNCGIEIKTVTTYETKLVCKGWYY